uniref:Putative secreted protein n=1 Tax=Ixodes ricinus TaxID=34613 RepID=A0A6B0U1M9_IXORI
MAALLLRLGVVGVAPTSRSSDIPVAPPRTEDAGVSAAAGNSAAGKPAGKPAATTGAAAPPAAGTEGRTDAVLSGANTSYW